MNVGQLHRYGEVHALRGGWWLLAPFFGYGRAICHTKGRRLYSLFDNGSEAVTCNWCRQKLGLVTYRKGPKLISPPGEPLPGYEPETSRASILFAEPKEE